MRLKAIVAVSLFALSSAAIAQDLTGLAKPPKPEECPASGFYPTRYGTVGRNAGDGPAPHEVVSPCTPQAVIDAADAIGMARSHFNSPLGVKNVVTSLFSATGTFADAGGKAAPVQDVTVHMHYGIAASRIMVTRGGKKEIRVFNDGYSWNEASEGVGATPAAGTEREREILNKLTPFGAVWSAAEAEGTAKVSQENGHTVITSTSPFDKLEVTTTLDEMNRPQSVSVRDGDTVYGATFSDYRDTWEPNYLVIFPAKISWTRNGKPFADMTVTKFNSNPYVVFPVPAEISKAGIDRSAIAGLPKRKSPFSAYAKSLESANPTPRLASGKPDLNGTWANVPSTAGPGGVRKPGTFEPDQAVMQRASGWDKPMYKPEYWEKVRSLDFSKVDVDPAFGCLKPGTPRMNAPTKILQTEKELVLFNPGQMEATRFLTDDHRPHTEADMDQSTFLGIPSAHWEGDVLVVESVGFTDQTWLQWQGYFHSNMMKVTERFWRQGDLLFYNYTVDDPEVLMEPWTQGTLVRRLAPAGTRMDEAAPCEIFEPEGDLFMRG